MQNTNGILVIKGQERTANISRRETIRARIAPAVIVAIIALIVSIVSLTVSTYQTWYSNLGIEAGTTIKMSWDSSTSTTATGTFKPSKGTLTYGWQQKSGTSSCKYTFSYKKNSQSSYTTKRTNYSFAKNNTHYGDWTLCSASGSTTYNFKVVKTAGLSTKSTVWLDLLVS